jgi:CRP-like cAMP-binding protein
MLRRALLQVVFQHGEHIIRQADFGKDFFIIQTGEVVCTVRKDATNQQEVPKVRP